MITYPSLQRGLCLVLAVLAGTSCTDDPAPSEPDASLEPSLATAAPLTWYQVSGGGAHTCGITTDSRLFCWGYNASGQLGDGTRNDRWTPTPVATALRFRQVSAGQFDTCAITTEFRAYCWGNNGYGGLGDGTKTDRLRPVAVSSGRQYRRIETDNFHTCAVGYLDSRAYCWGYNNQGQVGDGTTINRLTPVRVAGTLRFNQVTAGGYHSCGVSTENRAWCWGYNREGQLGDRTQVVRRLTPTRVADGHQFRQLNAGDAHNCGVTTDKRAYCWGNGRSGQIGNGYAYLSFWPRAVAGGLFFDRVTAGLFHTCGETTTNKAYCWGSNAQGRLGDGTTTQRLKPALIPSGHLYLQLSAGESHSCGVTANEALCWGDGSIGKLGNGTDNDAWSPTLVSGTM